MIVSNPKIFGLGHIIYFIVFALVFAAMIYVFCFRLKSQKHKVLMMDIVAGALLAAIIFNRVSIAVVSGKAVDLIPSSFCGFSSFVLSVLTLAVRNKNHCVFHCVCYVAFVGGMITMFYPDFIGQADSIFYSKTISGLLHHSIGAMLAMLFFLSGIFVPDIKKFVCLPLGLCVYMTFGLFLMEAFGLSSPMNIGQPLVEGSILTWYFVGFLVIVLQTAFLLSLYFYRKKKN